MSQIHAIVWLDHQEAKVVEFSLGKHQIVAIHSKSPERRIHHKANTIGSGKAADDHEFFDSIARNLTSVHEVLIAGPGNAKTAFMTYIADRHVNLAARVVGVETLDHPTEPQLLAHAKQYFKAADQLGVATPDV